VHPKFNLVIVEGGKYSIQHYKKLILNRINWTENDGPNAVRKGNMEAPAKWLEAQDENGELKDLSLNTCQLVFESEEKLRAFKEWLGARVEDVRRGSGRRPLPTLMGRLAAK
jgi:U4/U6 small nuclear ribonucleoprotein PRP3